MAWCQKRTSAHNPHEWWSQIDRSLRVGSRGLTPGSSVARLLARYHHVRRSNNIPPVTKGQIIRWAIAHYRRFGTWPTRKSGAIQEALGETWARINWALVQGNRGFKKGSSLAKLLAQYGKHRNRKGLPRLRIRPILRWADQYIRRTKRWPTHLSGQIANSHGETWGAVNAALYRGGRGFPGGSSLFRFLKEHKVLLDHRH